MAGFFNLKKGGIKMTEKNVCPICSGELKTRTIPIGPVGWGRKIYTKKKIFCPKCKIVTFGIPTEKEGKK